MKKLVCVYHGTDALSTNIVKSKTVKQNKQNKTTISTIGVLMTSSLIKLKLTLNVYPDITINYQNNVPLTDNQLEQNTVWLCLTNSI